MSDASDGNASDPRQQRAREWIRLLTELPDRFAGSLYERQAAERIGAWMKELGLSDVTIVNATGGPRPGLMLALHTGLAAFGCYWWGLIGFAMALVGAVSFSREFRQRQPFLSRLLRSGDSVNVVGRAGRSDAPRRVILTAHIDTTEAGWMFTKAVAERFAGLNQQGGAQSNKQPKPPHALPELLLVSATLVALAGWIGAHGFLFGVIKLGACGGLLIATVLGVQWAMSMPTPGANDNASAVAAMLTCAESLKAALPEDVELWVVGTGAEECGSGGMHDLVDRHPEWPPESTFYINFECVGGGALHYILTEGLLGRVTYPPMLIEVARRLAASGRFGEVTPTHLLAGTDGNVPARKGYPALSLISLEANGVPRNYHRVEDTVDGIDLSMVVRSADFGSAAANAALHGALDPISA
ncbi:MAG: M28 family peptidase [Deltaproteobacteria bacterium]|nr:M28 family peptidase [Deltaproteobacteria bacterium]